MLVSIITPARTAGPELDECVASVRSQTHKDVQHILVAAPGIPDLRAFLRSHDGWFDQVLSGQDQGLYPALNAGLGLCRGEVVCFLNSDDLYAGERSLEQAVSELCRLGVDSVYGDLVYVRRRDPGRVVRYWRSGPHVPEAFRRGWMPPHPAFFARRAVYELCRGYDPRFAISGDYELLLRLFEKHRISTAWLPEVLVKMRTGGMSNRSVPDILRKTAEDLRAWQVNGLSGGPAAVLLKNLRKLPQLFQRP